MKDNERDEVRIAESKFISELVNKNLRLEKENNQLRAEIDYLNAEKLSLLKQIAKLSGKGTFTLSSADEDAPEFVLGENLAGEIIYSVAEKETDELDFDSIYKSKRARRNKILPVKSRKPKTITYSRTISVEIKND